MFMLYASLNVYVVCIIKFLAQETRRQKNKHLTCLIQLSWNTFTVTMQTSAPQLALEWWPQMLVRSGQTS